MLELTESGSVLVVAGELDIYAVGDARPRFEATQQLDLSDVSAIDGAGVQLLAWWCGGGEGRAIVRSHACVQVACAALGLERLVAPP